MTNLLSNQSLLTFAFYWLLPFSIALATFMSLIKYSDKMYQHFNFDRLWHYGVRIGIIFGLLLMFWVWFTSTSIPDTIIKYSQEGINYAKNVGAIMKVVTFVLVWVAKIVAFFIHWTPVYVRAFVVVYVIGTAIQIRALIWRIHFVYALNIILPMIILFPYLAFKYFLGYQTPFFDYIYSRLYIPKVKENASDAWDKALQGRDDSGNAYKEGAGGSSDTVKKQHAGLAIRWSRSSVVTKGGHRIAELVIHHSREMETDNLLKTSLKGLGRKLSAPSVRFQEDPLEDYENTKGFKFDSDVLYNAGDNLGSWRTIFINPFTEDAKIANGGRGAWATFEGVLIGVLQYISNITPVAIYDKIKARALQLYTVDTSADKAKYKAQQNLDLSVIPVPTDPKSGNSIDKQREIAIENAKKKIGDVTNVLNANKLTGDFAGVVVGGSTAVYSYTLPRTADLPTDFAKIQENVSNMLKISDVPIIKLQAGILSLTMINSDKDGNPINIPVDFAKMVSERSKGMSTIISGMAGVDALGKNIYFELGDKNPHAMLFGKTGTGKTVTIMTILYSIMSAVDPTMLKIAYVDGKGNSFEFMRTDNNDSPDYHPNPFTYAQPADASGDIEYARALIKYIEKVTRERIQKFKEDAVSKLADYNKKHPEDKLPEILFVVDEFSAITQQDKNLKASEIAEKGTVDTFEYIAKMARSVGIRMILANQSARKELVPGKISANVTGRISLGVAEPIESEIALPDAKIAVHLISQAGEFYSIMNGIRNPEHGNSPYLPDKVMHDLNAGLEKKFGHQDYVVTREQVIASLTGEDPNDKIEVPDPLPTESTPIADILKLIEKYPRWAVQNEQSSVFNRNKELISTPPRERKETMHKLTDAIAKAKEQAKLLAESKTARTHRSTGANTSTRIADINKGRNRGIR